MAVTINEFTKKNVIKFIYEAWTENEDIYEDAKFNGNRENIQECITRKKLLCLFAGKFGIKLPDSSF